MWDEKEDFCCLTFSLPPVMKVIFCVHRLLSITQGSSPLFFVCLLISLLPSLQPSPVIQRHNATLLVSVMGQSIIWLCLPNISLHLTQLDGAMEEQGQRAPPSFSLFHHLIAPISEIEGGADSPSDASMSPLQLD